MRRRPIFPLVLLLSLVISATAGLADGILPPFYSAKEIRATVVDAETGQPIEGGVVVAVWQLEQISGQGPRLQVTEVLTDAQGKLLIPGWGPKPRPPLTEFRKKSPFLVIFKGGYTPVQLYNARKPDFARLRAMTNLTAGQISYRIASYEGNPSDSTQESLWDGMTIRVEPFRGAPEEWFRNIDQASRAIALDDAKHAPRFYEALSHEREYFKTHPLNPEKVNRAVFESVFGGIEIRLKTRSGSKSK
jgi:hypothetical protein